MGGINKHPSCASTWEKTTLSAKSISLAFSAFFESNASLESVILSEFAGDYDSACNAGRMIDSIQASKQHICNAKEYLEMSIALGKDNGSPYQKDFRDLKPNLLVSMWENNLLVGCKEDIVKIAGEISVDHLGPASRFIESLTKLERLTENVEKVFISASEYAKEKKLRVALEENKIPLQANMALLLSHWLKFMREFLVDSVIATHVAFSVNKHSSLVA